MGAYATNFLGRGPTMNNIIRDITEITRCGGGSRSFSGNSGDYMCGTRTCRCFFTSETRYKRRLI